MSTKSQRPKAPGEKPAVDNLPQVKSGGLGAQQGTSQANPPGPRPGSAAGKTHGWAGAGGLSTDRSPRPVGAPAPSQAGKPGFATSEDAKRKGGTGKVGGAS